MGNTEIALFASDLHIPYHNKRHVDAWFKVLKYLKPSSVDIVGDLDDACPVSRWNEGKPEEILSGVNTYASEVQDFWRDVRTALPNADLHYETGNHEMRYDDYIAKKAPAFKDFITPEVLWKTDTYGVNVHWYNKPPVERFNGLYLHHGEAISKYAGESVRKDMDNWGVSILRGHCFSEDTEVLTPEGWKNYCDVNIGSQVMTLNRETGEGQWNTVNEKFVYDDFKELISVKAHGLDLLVTPGHGLWTSPRSKKLNFQESTAQDSFGKDRVFPLALIHDEAGIDLTDDQIRFIAWLMTDGTIEKYQDGSPKQFRFAQSAVDHRIDELSRVLTEVAPSHSKKKRYHGGTVGHGVYHNYDAYRFNVPRREVEDWIWKYIDINKTPTNALRGMSQSQINVMIKALWDGDGGKNKDSDNAYQFNTARQDHLDFVQELAVRAGFRTSTSRSPKRTHWTLTMNTRDVVYVNATNWSKVEYDGKVWCVSVDNGTLVVRRNGRTAITLNSHRMGSTFETKSLANRTLEGYEIGHMVDITSEGMAYVSQWPWQAGFAWAHVYEGKAHVQLARFIDDVVIIDGKPFKA